MRNPNGTPRDHDGEMRSHNGPADEAIDALLDGTPSQELAGTPLADLVDRIRLDAATTEPRASDELAALMAHGLAPTEKGDLPATAGSNATAPSSAAWLPKWTRSAVMFRKLIIAKLAALGIVLKAGAAGAAVVTVAAGVGAAGQLPAPAQAAFDRIAEQGDEQGDEQEEPGEEVELLEDAEDSLDEDSDGNGPPEDRFGAEVSDDARGEDGTPGVDGQEISEKARERARQRAEERGFGGPPEDGENRGRSADARTDDAGDDDAGDDDLSDLEDSVDSGDSLDSLDDDDSDGPPEGVPSGPPTSTPAGPPAAGDEG